MSNWPWWLGALALSGTAFAYLLLIGRPLGVSGAVGTALTGGAPPGNGALGRGASALFLGGVVLGGTLFAVVGHAAHVRDALELAPAALYARLFPGASSFAALFAGGVLVGFGTSWAGGCTSGHGLVGCGRLQPPSLLATACFFGTAIAASLAMRALVLGGAS